MIIARGFTDIIVTRGYGIIPFYGDKKEFDLYLDLEKNIEVEL